VSIGPFELLLIEAAWNARLIDPLTLSCGSTRQFTASFGAVVLKPP
jgi:hypothetical protein